MDDVADGINQLSARKEKSSPKVKINDRRKFIRHEILRHLEEESSSNGEIASAEEKGVKYYAPSFHKKNQMHEFSEAAIRAFT